jgi:hypothetical protein
MTHAKKNPAGAGEVSKKSKGKRKKSVGTQKKVLDKIPIPFPFADRHEAEKFVEYIGRREEGCTCRTGLGVSISADGSHEKGEKGAAAEDQRIDQKIESTK